jgi:glycosyltransferase involved in cell wall biosynthesis
MHVGFALLTLFPGRVGGSETYVRGLLGAFADGHGPERVTVLANRHVVEPYAGFERGPVRLHEVTSYRPGDSSATRLMAMLSGRLAPKLVERDVPRDLDVLHHPVTVPIPRATRPRVVSLQDLQHHELPGMFSAAERRFRGWAYDDSARTADLVMVPSLHTRAALQRYAGVPPERVVVAPHGIDHDRFTHAPGAADAELDALGLPDRFVVFPGNLWPHKNHERLIEALALTADRDTTLILTGQQGPRLAELLEQAGRRGVADRVRHLGYLPAAQVPALYRRATGMVFPSLFEGFGFPVLEAMACGCPVAASTVGSLAELVGEATIPLEPEDPRDIARALDELTGDAERRAALRQAGLARAAQYGWEASARAHAEAYARVAADS